MVSGFATPWWLLALAIIPLVRWLHRWRAPLSRASVSALFLWTTTEAVSASGLTRQTPDPAWRRRALIASLLILALAGPWFEKGEQRITVWVDDTFSMRTIEQGQSRLAEGLRLLQTALNESGSENATLRSLSDPARQFLANDQGAFDASRWLNDPPLAADPPPPALMSRDVAHWIVTDGASERLSDWSARTPLSRVITVGNETENVAVVRLAARHSVEKPDTTDLLVSVTNRGGEPARRELVLQTGLSEQIIDTFDLAPGEIRHTEFSVARGIEAPVAMLRPGDALEADDALALDTGPLDNVPVIVDSACPNALQRAIDTHPAMRSVSEATDAELQLLCSDRVPAAPLLIRFHTDAPAPIRGTPTWLPDAGTLQNVQLRRAWIFASAWPEASRAAEHVPLLVDGDHVLISYRKDAATVVETTIDPGQADFVAQPEYAAFVAGLTDMALGRSVLDPVAMSARDPVESDVAPSVVGTLPRAGLPRSTSTAELSNLLLALAMIVLLVDIIVLWRARRATHHA